MRLSIDDMIASWFMIYQKVGNKNQGLLPESDLKGIVTTIYISASTHGLIVPAGDAAFEKAVLALLNTVADRSEKEKLYKKMSALVKVQAARKKKGGARGQVNKG